MHVVTTIASYLYMYLASQLVRFGYMYTLYMLCNITSRLNNSGYNCQALLG